MHHAVSVLLAALACQGTPPGEGLYDRVSRASAEIYLDGHLLGSGWFAAPEGLVVTVAHGLWGVKGKVEAATLEGTRLGAEIVAFDRGHDLALLKVPRGERPYPFLEVAPRVPEAGAEVFLYGAAFFRHGLLLSGRVARAIPGYEYYPEQKCCARVYYIAGPSPKGVSGGCWVDAKGRVVGGQSGLMTPPGGPAGIAFAAPPEALLRLVRERTPAATADLGVTVEELGEQAAELIRRYPSGSRGVVAALVHEGGPSHAAGIRKHAMIVSVGGSEVQTRDAFYDALRRRRPGDEVSLVVLNPDSKETTRLTLAPVALESAPAGEGKR